MHAEYIILQAAHWSRYTESTMCQQVTYNLTSHNQEANEILGFFFFAFNSFKATTTVSQPASQYMQR